MTRLLEGKPIHTNPQLLKENLYREARVSRATMYRHQELLDRWDEAVSQRRAEYEVRESERITTLEKKVAELTQALSKTRLSLQEAQARVRDSASVISALYGENLVLGEQLAASGEGTVTSIRAPR